MFNIENIKNIREILDLNISEIINCDIKFENFNEYLPYTASIYDKEKLGRDIHELCISGEFGKILPPLLPSIEDQIKIIESNKMNLILESSNIIELLRDASEGGYIRNEDIDKLEKWKKYRYELTKINISDGKIIWPEKPE